MFIIYITNRQELIERKSINTYLVELKRCFGQLDQLPEGVQQLSEDVWFVPSVGSLSLLAKLGEVSCNLGFEFGVKGLHYQLVS